MKSLGARAIVVLVLVAGLLQLSAQAQALTEGDRAILGRMTYFSGDEPRVFPVRLTTEARMANTFGTPNPDFRMGGRGRFVGIVIMSEPPSPDGLVVSMGNVSRCIEPGCVQDSFDWTRFTKAGRFVRKIRLPPGDYRLYLVTDTQPVSGWLRLHGPTGKTNLQAGETAEASFDLMTTHLQPPLGPVMSAGDTFEFNETTYQFAATWLRGRPALLWEGGYCLYEGGVPEREALAYSTMCEDMGARVWRHGGSVVSTQVEILFMNELVLAPGTWSFGNYYSGAWSVDETGSFLLQLSG